MAKNTMGLGMVEFPISGMFRSVICRHVCHVVFMFGGGE